MKYDRSNTTGKQRLKQSLYMTAMVRTIGHSDLQNGGAKHSPFCGIRRVRDRPPSVFMSTAAVPDRICFPDQSSVPDAVVSSDQCSDVPVVRADVACLRAMDPGDPRHRCDAKIDRDLEIAFALHCRDPRTEQRKKVQQGHQMDGPGECTRTNRWFKGLEIQAQTPEIAWSCRDAAVSYHHLR